MASPNTLKLTTAGAAIAMACVVSVARAETYKWIDAQGRVQYTDRLPTEAVNRGNTQLSKQGVAKTVTGASLTSEQRAAIEEREARERENAKVEREKLNKENALLSSYSSEQDIEIARKRNLAIIGAAIQSAEGRIKTLQRRAEALEREKLFYEKKPFPEKLKRELASVQAEIPKQYTVIAQKNEDALAVNQHYDDQRVQFVALKSKLAAQSGALPKRP